MKILITGGAGFLGRRIAKEAKRRGADVAVFTRNSDKELESLGIKIIAGDIMSREQLKRAFAGYDVVYHLAAEIDESSKDLWNINVEGTRNVVRACKASGIKRLIFASSIGVLGGSQVQLTEDSPHAPETAYEKTKAAAEKLVVASGIPYTIVRMPPIVGPNKTWQKIFDAAKKEYPIIGSGENYWALVYIDDAIEALLKMLRQIAKNQVYNIAEAEPHKYNEVYFTITRVLVCPAPEKHMPVWIAIIGAFFYELKCKLAHKKPSVTLMMASIKRLTSNRIVSIEKAKRDLDYSPKYTLKDAMSKTAEGLEKI
ncbi:MAG: NAD-dependent epimerase/dehydratase family protein [Nanoarchaeota archaeon]|nr:NAD-dependent epimerase/dehydratase family protein [Nanoarchaeota archaeon]MBU4300493.1 NAD-dependent epimerase/dehydratase family protein [Nanoarchaeota archaeon]MBU4451973.1 NAD-dependent epimerase/dehydratase family protein [Nanoarchaeota archaeon]MCG2724133.1 NAD-dependent epimerase/dehydratase family protein [archaeon]